MPKPTPIPRHEDPPADALAKLMLAVPDLETIIETGHCPDDLCWIRELAAAGRRLFAWADAERLIT